MQSQVPTGISHTSTDPDPRLSTKAKCRLNTELFGCRLNYDLALTLVNLSPGL